MEVARSWLPSPCRYLVWLWSSVIDVFHTPAVVFPKHFQQKKCSACSQQYGLQDLYTCWFKIQSCKQNGHNSSSKGELWVCMYGTVHLSRVLVVIIETKSFCNWAHSPFLSSARSHCLSPYHLVIAHPFCSIVSPQYCLWQFCHFVTHPLYPLFQHCPQHISFPFSPLLRTSFLGLVVLTCWLKKKKSV